MSRLSTVEEIEVELWFKGDPECRAEASASLRRWQYLLEVAEAAERGVVLDRSLPQVTAAPAEFSRRARRMVEALEAWIRSSLL